MRRSKRRDGNNGAATSPAARAMGISDEMFERAKRVQHHEWWQHGRMVSLTKIVERMKAEASGEQ